LYLLTQPAPVIELACACLLIVIGVVTAVMGNCNFCN